MKYLKQIVLSIILLLFFCNNYLQAKPREVARLEKLDKIQDEDRVPSTDSLYVLIVFKACCTPNEQAMDWAGEAFRKKGECLSFTALNVDKPRSISKVKNWLKAREIGFTVFSDPSGQEASALKVFAPPSVIIFNSDGQELYRTLGFRPNDKHRLNKILGIVD